LIIIADRGVDRVR